MKNPGETKISHTTLKSTWKDVTDATSDDGGRDWHIKYYICTNCGCGVGSYNITALRYCEWCGARMVKNETD